MAAFSAVSAHLFKPAPAADTAFRSPSPVKGCGFTGALLEWDRGCWPNPSPGH
ncbi:hypothetical protein [Entomobacter blattae]|uniref:hypothetical protein n=1 Tax=Entomobacter blattae TaxID=2762277 RepID=UPI00193BF8F2|nr:hypothetical protein [Entomobacter blattae]